MFVRIVSLAIILVATANAAELQMLQNVKLTNNTTGDGDSFLVNAGGKTLHIRLYFVDSPETSASSKNDAIRLRTQSRYFGLQDARQTIYFGKQAKNFTREILSQPFTVHTVYANALGRSRGGRVYGFVTTNSGEDLASLLVQNGLARAYGNGRKTPDGVSRTEMFAKLQDLETAATLQGIGVWSLSDPEKIEQLRQKQRREDQEITNLQTSIANFANANPANGKININTASKQQLMSVKGIGEVYADRIIENRPFATIGDLVKIRGIGDKKLQDLAPFLAVDNFAR